MRGLWCRREANSGAYRLSTFFAAKTLVTFPMQVRAGFALSGLHAKYKLQVYWQMVMNDCKEHCDVGTFSCGNMSNKMQLPSKSLISIWLQAFVTVLFCVLMYYITGYQNVASKFGIFLAVSTLMQFISETIGCVSAIITKTATVGILVSTSILTVET